MNYTLHQLQIYTKVVEFRSITKAANEMYLTQPAVSIQLKKFQEQFPRPLFEVINRQLFITDFGHEVAESALRILAEVDELDLRTHAFSGELAGTLKIALVSTAKYIMPFFLRDFLDQNKKVKLKMDVTNRFSVGRSLETNKADFGLVSVIDKNLNVNSIELMNNKLFLIGGKQHKLIDGNISKKHLAQLPIVVREKGSATRQSMEEYLNQNNVKGTNRLELTSNEAVKQAVIAGLGYSIMPLIGIKNELETGDLKIIRANNLPIVTTWKLIWMNSKRLTITALAFVDFIEKHKSEIIKKSFHWFEAY